MIYTSPIIPQVILSNQIDIPRWIGRDPVEYILIVVVHVLEGFKLTCHNGSAKIGTIPIVDQIWILIRKIKRIVTNMACECFQRFETKVSSELVDHIFAALRPLEYLLIAGM